MDKAYKEIGAGRAWRYGVGQLQASILKCLLLPPQLRVPLLRLFGSRIGRNNIIHPVSFCNLYRSGFKGLSIGNECFIGEECLLDLAGPIQLDDQVTLGERVTIMTHMNVGYRDHPLQSAFPSQTAGVRIGSGSFIGTNATLLAGVTIGRRCLVAAGALVNRDVPDSTVVAGVPAKHVKALPSG